MSTSMAAPLTKLFSSNLLLLLLASFLLGCNVSAHEFRVGGPKGWTKPTGDELENYNHWATMNRFHVGDSLLFKYENDSVLVVDKAGYKECNTTEPLLEFADGNTTFTLDHHGFFFFISGEPGHCESGQRLIVRVMVHPEGVIPGPAPSPQGSSSEVVNSASAAFKNTAAAASVVVAVLGSALTILKIA